MPRIARHCLIHGALGFGLAAVFTAALLALDIGELGSLVRQAEAGAGVVVLLVLLHGSLFAVVQIGVALACHAEAEAAPPGPGRTLPVPVRAVARVAGNRPTPRLS